MTGSEVTFRAWREPGVARIEGAGFANRAKAARRIAVIQARTAERRQAWVHEVTKRLATGWATIAIEDLNVTGMTASAAGTRDNPGRNVRAKAGLNRAILDTAFGEFRRQLGYKTSWYGSQLITVDRWLPSSKTCSHCGWTNPHLTLAVRTFHCQRCGLTLDRDHNAAINIATAADQKLPDGTGDGRHTTRAKSKPAVATVDPSQPDTRDTRAPEATNPVPMEADPATAGPAADVGRPPATSRRPPRQSNLPAFHAQPP